MRIASASRSSYAGCTATHSAWSTARDTSRGVNPGADGCAASTTSSYGWARAGSRPAACSTCWYSSSRIGSVGSVPTALATAVTVRGRTVRSASTRNGSAPASSEVPAGTSSGGSRVGVVAVNVTRPVAARGGWGWTCRRCINHSRVWSGIWLKR